VDERSLGNYSVQICQAEKGTNGEFEVCSLRVRYNEACVLLLCIVAGDWDVRSVLDGQAEFEGDVLVHYF
jgi:hypothetical protein